MTNVYFQRPYVTLTISKDSYPLFAYKMWRFAKRVDRQAKVILIILN